MSLTFSPEDTALISELVSQAQDDALNSSVGAYTPVYQYIFDLISEVDLSGNNVPSSALDQSEQSVWLRGALQANADDGSYFSNFIRDYTQAQYTLRYGSTLPNADEDTNPANDYAGRLKQSCGIFC